MTRRTKLIFLLLLLAAGSLLADQTTPEYGIRDKTPTLRAFIKAHLIISPDKTIEDGVLLIDKGKIIAAGKKVSIPDGATIIDLNGMFVYPGFVDPYTGYGLKSEAEASGRGHNNAPQYTASRVGGSAWNAAIHADRNNVDEFKPDHDDARKFMEQGFTTVQSMRMDGIFRGRGFVVSLGDRLPNDLVLSSHSWHCASFDKGSSRQSYPGSRMGAIALIRQTLYDADWYARAHAAFGLNPSQEAPEFNASLAALNGLPPEQLVFESDDELSLMQANRIGQEFGFSLIHVGSGKEYSAIDQIVSTGAPIFLPVNYPDPPSIKTLEDEFDVTLAQLRHWESAPGNAAVLAEHNVPFAFTTFQLDKKKDFLPNIRKAIERGLKPRVALEALTTRPAALCGVDHLVGTLEPGKEASFFICDKDIFEDEATIHEVWTQGDRHELKPIPKVDLRGTYSMIYNEIKIELQIKGTASEIKGDYVIDADTSKLKDVAGEDNRLSFVINLDTLEVDGAYRFTGRLEEEVLKGYCLTPDGTRSQWSATRTAGFVADKDSKKKDEPKPEQMLSRTSYPNRSFGLRTRPKQEKIFIEKATVWTSEDVGILQATDVLIKDGKIAAIGTDLKKPKDARIINGRGKHITAGIIDEHSHIAIDGDVNEGTHANSAEVRIGDVVDPYDINIYRQLAGGVTASHILHGSANPIGGQLQVIKLRWGEDSEGLKFKAAPPSIKFALGENVKQSNWGDRYKTRYPQTRLGVEAFIRDAFQAAREYEAEFKDYNSLGGGSRKKTVPPRRDLQLDALVEVLNSRLFVACHAYAASEMLMLTRLAEEYGFHIRTFEHGLEGYKIAKELAEAGVGLSSFSDWWAYKFEVYDAIPQNVALLNDYGVLASINSDNGEMARRLNQEAAKMVMYAGMAPEEAIKMVTINPAQQLMVDDRIGSIKVGKDADFVLWNGNPLSVYSKPEQTWIEGRLYFDLKTDLRMREEVRAEKAALIQKLMKSIDKDKGKEDSKQPPGDDPPHEDNNQTGRITP